MKGLANKHSDAIVAAREDQPFQSIDDLWRRANVPSASLVQLAEADAFQPGLKLARLDEADDLWPGGCRRLQPCRPDIARPSAEFFRADLSRRRIITCEDAMNARDGKWLEAADLVLVRQRPCSAKGMMFITIEDETSRANVVVWLKTFETYRRVVLGADTVGVYDKVQHEGEVATG